MFEERRIRSYSCPDSFDAEKSDRAGANFDPSLKLYFYGFLLKNS